MPSDLEAPISTGTSGTERPSENPDYPWRFGCAYGHSAWYRTSDGRYFCRSCDEPFDRLHDKKAEGVLVPPGGEGE